MIDFINNHFGEIGQIQKIYSSATTIDIAIRFPGKTQHLYIGRGAGTEGLWISEKRIPSELRKIDKFLEYLRRYLSGCTFQGLELDESDRCVKIKYGRAGKLCSLLLFYAGRDLYFENCFFDDKSGEMMLFKSWKNNSSVFENENLYQQFDEVGRTNIPKSNTASESVDIESILHYEYKRIENSQGNKKKTHFLMRKIKKISIDLEKLEKSDELIALANNLNEDFAKYPSKLKILGVKFNFYGTNHYQRRDEIFQKAKRFKTNKKILENRLDEAKKQLILLEQKNQYQNKLKCISPVWKIAKENSPTVVANKEQSYYVTTMGLVDYGVGESAFGNDQLRKIWATKDDIWFHLESGISSHIIVKLKGEPLSEEVFKNVAKLMNKVMGTHSIEVDLIYTQVKNLKGVKGTKGKVIYKKEKHIRVQL